jgi:hypothetical protein
MKVRAIELAVGEVQHLAKVDAQILAGKQKFSGTQLGQFFVRLRSAAVPRRRPSREADYVDLDAPVRVQRQRPAKRSRFIVRVGSDAE